MEELRRFLKTYTYEDLFYSGKKVQTDQLAGIPHPPLQKDYPADAMLIDLIAPEELNTGTMPLVDVIRKRRSHRKYSDSPLSLEELSFLLWATQGVHEVWREGIATRRTVPSGGSRHPFETYLVVINVEELERGLYRYLPLEHKLYLISADECLPEDLVASCMGQAFVSSSAVTFIWTAIPYRTEWRYSKASHKIIALDVGHICQNLYLACESIGAGTCAIGAYFQDKMDALLGIDGIEEFAIYVAPVGKIE